MKNKIKNISVISTGSWVPSDLQNQDLKFKRYKVFIKKLILDASIGIHEHEKKKKQKIAISLELDVKDNISEVKQKIENFVSYEIIIKNIKKLVSKKHIDLLETLGEKILKICFEDERIFSIKLKLEKIEVFKETDSVGIEIFREKINPNNLNYNSRNVSRLKE